MLALHVYASRATDDVIGRCEAEHSHVPDIPAADSSNNSPFILLFFYTL